MKKLLVLSLSILALSVSAHALETKSRTMKLVNGYGWNVDGGWLTPMTEDAADGLLAAERLDKKNLTCDVKGVYKRAEWNLNVLDFLAYSITNCK
jgi:hypothetical protein